jgi:Holliday junction DNA helicase RuvA
MFEYIEGKLALKMPNYLVVEQNGIGYRIDVPLSTYNKLKDASSARIYTYLKHSEDELRLYGFATPKEKLLFIELIHNVGQLGPSKALAILSAVDVEVLAEAIERQDLDFLKSARGIGDKLARRILTEMKGKLPSGLVGPTKAPSGGLIKDAIDALVLLGYEKREARDAVRRAQQEFKTQPALEEVIKKALDFVR